jgi:hypothetical protein
MPSSHVVSLAGCRSFDGQTSVGRRSFARNRWQCVEGDGDHRRALRLRLGVAVAQQSCKSYRELLQSGCWQRLDRQRTVSAAWLC